MLSIGILTILKLSLILTKLDKTTFSLYVRGVVFNLPHLEIIGVAGGTNAFNVNLCNMRNLLCSGGYQ